MPALGQAPPAEPPAVQVDYVLGPGDEIAVWARDAEELSQRAYRVGGDGFLSMPVIGRIQASGATLSVLEKRILNALKAHVLEPEVSVTLTDTKSQPVSVFGAVNRPGVVQLQGRKTLFEVLSMAEGLRQEAGHSVRITRRSEWGKIPLPGATEDPSGKFSTATVNLKSTLEASNPEDNIPICPYDVISVPRAELIYVVGDVKKAGGFPLTEQENISVLQALSLAEGLEKTAAPGNARILRNKPGGNERIELRVNLKRILSGKSDDVTMKAGDILFVPNSLSRSAGARAVESAIQLATGLVIWRR